MLAIVFSAIFLHPVHETFCEVEWNDKTKRMEVALRIDPLDEQWLAQQIERRDLESSNWRLDYLEETFRFGRGKTTDKINAKSVYRWVGREDERTNVWWYFEIAPVDGKRPEWIQQRMLFEREPDHANRVLVLGQKPHRSLTLTLRRSKANLEATINESKTDAPR